MKKGFVLSVIGMCFYAVGDTLFNMLMRNQVGKGPMLVMTAISLAFVFFGVLSSIRAAQSPAERNKDLLIQAAIVGLGYLFGFLAVFIVIIIMFVLFMKFGNTFFGGGSNTYTTTYTSETTYTEDEEYYDKSTGRALQSNSDGSHVRIDGEWVKVSDLSADNYGVRDK